jgi:hypothetical protein
MNINGRRSKVICRVALAIATLPVLACQAQVDKPVTGPAARAAQGTAQHERLLAHVGAGFIDQSGALAIGVSGRFHGKFSNGLARVWQGVGQKWGYIDANGKLVIQPAYDWALPFSEGLAAVNVGARISNDRGLRGADVMWARIEGGKWIFIDKSGKAVMETPYTEVGSFHDGLAPVKSNDKWGYIDKAGKIVVPPRFENADELRDGMGAVLLGHRWGFIGKSGEQVVEPRYPSRIELMGGQIIMGVGFSNGLAWVGNGPGKWGVIDSSGQFVIPPQYGSYGSDFSDGLAAVKTQGKTCIIDKSGKVLLETDYGQISEFSEGIASFWKGKLWGAMDKTGKVIIEPQFSRPFKFSQGLAAVETEVETGPQRISRNEYYIDKSGARLFSADDAWEFQRVIP